MSCRPPPGACRPLLPVARRLSTLSLPTIFSLCTRKEHPSCAVRVASVTLRKISRSVARFACPICFSIYAASFVCQAVFALIFSRRPDYSVHPSDRADVYYVFFFSFSSTSLLLSCPRTAFVHHTRGYRAERRALVAGCACWPPRLPLSGRSLTVKNLNARVPLPLPRTCVLDEACEPAHLIRLLMIDVRPYRVPPTGSGATSRVCASLVHLASSGVG